MLRIVVLSLLFSVFANGEMADSKCQFTRCRGEKCGCLLLRDGWKKIAACDGHQWSYILEKNGKRVKCTGIAARGGYEEDTCQPFTGDLEKFKLCR